MCTHTSLDAEESKKKVVQEEEKISRSYQI